MSVIERLRKRVRHPVLLDRDRRTEIFLGLLFMLVPLTLSISLGGCPPRPAPQVPRYDAAERALYPTCSVPDGGTLPTYADVCDGFATRDRRACVLCPSAHGCLDTTDKVYCVAGNSCDGDPMCSKVTP